MSSRGLQRRTARYDLNVIDNNFNDETTRTNYNAILAVEKTNEAFVDDNMFQHYNLNFATSFDDCYAEPVDSSSGVCFNDNPKCTAIIINGFCSNCLEQLLGIRIAETFLSDNITAYRQNLAFSTNSKIKGPTKIFPVLSMQGKLTISDLKPITSDQPETLNNIQTLLTQLSASGAQNSSNSSVTNHYLAIAIHYQKCHASIVKRMASEIKKTDVQVIFTDGYKPKNKLSSLLFNKAEQNTSFRSLMVGVESFSNIVDMYLMKLFLPNIFKLPVENDATFATVPNVQIIDGWFHYGLGTGNHCIPTQIKDDLVKKHIIVPGPLFKTYLGNYSYWQLRPLTLNAEFDGVCNNALAVVHNSKNRFLPVASAMDFVSDDYSSSLYRNY